MSNSRQPQAISDYLDGVGNLDAFEQCAILVCVLPNLLQPTVKNHSHQSAASIEGIIFDCPDGHMDSEVSDIHRNICSVPVNLSKGPTNFLFFCVYDDTQTNPYNFGTFFAHLVECRFCTAWQYFGSVILKIGDFSFFQKMSRKMAAVSGMFCETQNFPGRNLFFMNCM